MTGGHRLLLSSPTTRNVPEGPRTGLGASENDLNLCVLQPPYNRARSGGAARERDPIPPGPRSGRSCVSRPVPDTPSRPRAPLRPLPQPRKGFRTQTPTEEGPTATDGAGSALANAGRRSRVAAERPPGSQPRRAGLLTRARPSGPGLERRGPRRPLTARP